MAWLGYQLKDKLAQCRDNTQCYMGTTRGNTRKPHFCHIIISVMGQLQIMFSYISVS